MLVHTSLALHRLGQRVHGGVQTPAFQVILVQAVVDWHKQIVGVVENNAFGSSLASILLISLYSIM